MNELKSHVIKMLNADTRLDGRKLTDYRKVKIETGLLKTAEGSAKVTIGDTVVLVGIKTEVGTPYPDTPEEGSIIVGAELLPMSSPEFEPGPPGIQAIELARVTDRGIRESKALDFKKLCIEKGEKVWVIIIDICTINAAGNLFDAASLGAIAALKNAKYPEYDGEKIDYKKSTDKSIELEKIPIGVTVCKIGDKFIVDPDSEEEKAIEARLTVATDENGTLCAMQKGGDYPLSIEDIKQMVELGAEKGAELRSHLG